MRPSARRLATLAPVLTVAVVAGCSSRSRPLTPYPVYVYGDTPIILDGDSGYGVSIIGYSAAAGMAAYQAPRPNAWPLPQWTRWRPPGKR